MNSFQLVKNTLNDIATEDAVALEERLNAYRKLIKRYATDEQIESYDKALGFGWYLTFADNDSIELEKLGLKSTLVIYRDGSSSRERRLISNV
jgi:hypothetical protein|tara:strand:- start:324 stop:602 length:279 start_codon:yes stop_codon:yes gene_type:complete